MLNYNEVRPGGIVADEPLEELVKELKRSVVRMTEAAGGGYIAQGFCSAEVMATLFYRVLRLDPHDSDWADRDRFLLSVGHYAIAVYAAMEKLGFFDKAMLDTYSADGSVIEMIGSEMTPGIEITGGSLAQGLSQGVGLAIAAKLRGHVWRTVVYMSDGELEEGQTWEAAMVAGHHKLDNLLVVVDVNGVQADGRIEDVTGILPIAEKWQAFGWRVLEIDGNDLQVVLESLTGGFAPDGRPTIVVANTIMGNGVSSLHGKPDVHYVRWTPEQSADALREIAGEGAEPV
ncbi:transketolase [Paenibacillus cymbidii]|uniref:transketolase n=1 Tax=Paenibacillus cymbidii TaxID=1639034 RepID=UPI0014369CE3|nr:transketolase [Paenibacillus cymbidii]